ncbi:GntR family transcriptional regulator [Neorhizobium sp. Rsf11]|uniref:GntR family transcriptional regulator n=2 Tax=Neorhizobium TaxID=1525371 RepID=A0ABV0MC57_9HYPH|nr:GntR family transcriptional regulator [Neorhizobium petrolearium]MCC2613687.1 GntR family transcriptional regulator [Neorhizobium petrolearium]WGI72002.1 GntR family transcriptional regulator [Neorhizobium petrolearium]
MKDDAIPTSGRDQTKLSEQAYQYLRSLILARELGPGDVFTERKLAEQINVSRTPLRAAINRLVGEGLVSRLSSGSIVIRQVAVEELMEILVIRRLLEGEAAAQAAHRSTPGSVDVMLEKSRAVAADPGLDFDPFWEYDDEFHLFVADASGKPMLAQYIRNLRDKARMAHVVRMEKNFEQQALEHIAVLQAIADKKPDEAREAMSGHIDRVRERFMRWLFAD